MQRTLSIILVVMALFATIISYSVYLDIEKKKGGGEKVVNEPDKINTLCRFLNANCEEISITNVESGDSYLLENGANQQELFHSGKYVITTPYSGNIGSVDFKLEKVNYCAFIISLVLKEGNVVEVETIRKKCI